MGTADVNVIFYAFSIFLLLAAPVLTQLCTPSPCGPHSQCKEVAGHALCWCLPGFVGGPPSCRHECEVNTNCDTDKACINKKCINPCETACALGASCEVKNHNAYCTCPPGSTGDPFVKCNQNSQEQIYDACNPSPCGPNSVCREAAGGALCSCLPNFMGRPPSCRPECLTHNECGNDKACIKQKCKDPCQEGCGVGATCKTANHTRICSCPPGFNGDPFIKCARIGPVVSKLCNPLSCGPNSDCKEVNGKAVCSCHPNFVGSPPSCRAECLTNQECGKDNACIMQKCRNPCRNACGDGADCKIISHTSVCSCPSSYTGDPFVRCTRKGGMTGVCEPSPCGANSDCKEVNGNAVCSCLPGYISSPPTCRPECYVNDECNKDQACFNQKCRNPCPDACGQDALCEVVNHKSVCSCPYGYKGNPLIRCTREGVEDSQVCNPSPCGPNSNCRDLNGQAVCSCMSGYIGSPPSCGPECTTDEQCSRGLACLNQKCRAPCTEACGEGAICQVNRVTHRGRCVCPSGFNGDPYTKCTKINNNELDTKHEENTPTPSTQAGGCTLPNEAKNRKFCTFRCSDCERDGCWLWPGSKVTEPVLKVKCDDGYRSSDNQDYTTIGCIDGRWSQEFPHCIKLCPPLKSDSVFPRCFNGATQVDCNAPMLPGTSSTYRCRDSHREYPSLTAAGVYSRTLFCKTDGTWSYSLPECEPVCGVSKDGTVTPTVVDGKITKLGAFPWHAGLYRQDPNGWNCICGGSLITNRIVLTAAHCVFKMNPEDLKVGLGKVYRSWTADEPTGVKRDVSFIQLPDEYQGVSTTYTWDIALLLLSETVELNSFVMPVCRDTNLEFDITQNYTGYVVGWGKTAPNGIESEVLLHNDISIMTQNFCNRNIPQVLLFDKFCGAKNQVSIAEKGDSGGGLTSVVNNLHYVFGIVSVKFKNLSLFTNVSWDSHKRWIDFEIARLNSLI